jgi:hypothetical protein
MNGRVRLLLSAGVVMLLAACATVRGLDEPALDLSGEEKARVERQVRIAIDEKRWSSAWNQAVDAGASRERLEGIAMGALEAEDGVVEDMLEALFAKWGGLTPAGRARVDALLEEVLTAKWVDWERAAEIAIQTAEDAPAYARAWEIYEAAPPDGAQSILEAIGEARRTRETDD